MKTELLKNIIKEAVREAIKEELRDILTEAVTTNAVRKAKPTTSVKKETPLSQIYGNSAEAMAAGDPITEMLHMTQRSMTRDDFRNVMQAQMQPGMDELFSDSNSIPANLPAGPQPGLDISKLDFVKKAGAVYNKAKEKDNFRVGG